MIIFPHQSIAVCCCSCCCRPPSSVCPRVGWTVQNRLPASHRWPASPPSPPRVIVITRKREGGGRRPLLRRPRIALPAQKKRTPPHTHKLNGVEGQRTSCRKYHLVEDHCGPRPHTEGTPGGLGGRNRKDWNHASMLSCLVSFFPLSPSLVSRPGSWVSCM